jgi:hypothetical protein
LLSLLQYCGVLGTLSAVAVMPGCCARLPEPDKSWRCTLTLAGTGLLLTLISTGTSVEFFFAGPGTAIRPLPWAAAQFLLLLAGIAVAGWFGPWHVKSEAPRSMRWSGVLLCLSPFPVGELLLRWAVQVDGLIISE